MFERIFQHINVYVVPAAGRRNESKIYKKNACMYIDYFCTQLRHRRRRRRKRRRKSRRRRRGRRKRIRRARETSVIMGQADNDIQRQKRCYRMRGALAPPSTPHTLTHTHTHTHTHTRTRTRTHLLSLTVQQSSNFGCEWSPSADVPHSLFIVMHVVTDPAC